MPSLGPDAPRDDEMLGGWGTSWAADRPYSAATPPSSGSRGGSRQPRAVVLHRRAYPPRPQYIPSPCARL